VEALAETKGGLRSRMVRRQGVAGVRKSNVVIDRKWTRGGRSKRIVGE